jgi:hypothetical protein
LTSADVRLVAVGFHTSSAFAAVSGVFRMIMLVPGIDACDVLPVVLVVPFR